MATNPFDNISANFVRSPLGIIALFIVLVYAMAAIVAAFGNAPHLHLLILVIFLVTFPVLVLAVFYRLVTKHSNLIYGPADFRDDATFLTYSGREDDSSSVLRNYWQPDGASPDPGRTQALIEWMRRNGVVNVTVPEFIQDSKFAAARKKATIDLKL